MNGTMIAATIFIALATVVMVIYSWATHDLNKNFMKWTKSQNKALAKSKQEQQEVFNKQLRAMSLGSLVQARDAVSRGQRTYELELDVLIKSIFKELQSPG